MSYERLVRPLLFAGYGGDPERVHDATLRAIAAAGRVPPVRAALAAFCARHRTPVTVAGIEFPGLVGLAAGMDKNGIAVRTWGALGFGHVELGTVTAYAQPGNDAPRLFRLPQSRALVNRMGFNNHGAAALAVRLRAAGVARGHRAVGIPVGVSIGKTKTTPLAEATGGEGYAGIFPGGRVGTISGADLDAVLPQAEQASQLSLWPSDGEEWVLLLRPLLPGEVGNLARPANDEQAV